MNLHKTTKTPQAITLRTPAVTDAYSRPIIESALARAHTQKTRIPSGGPISSRLIAVSRGFSFEISL